LEPTALVVGAEIFPEKYLQPCIKHPTIITFTSYQAITMDFMISSPKINRKVAINLVLIFLSIHSLIAQTINIKEQKEQEIIEFFNKKNYYQVLTELDWYYERYPSNELFYRAMRFETWLRMNDRIHMREDLLKIEKDFPEFIQKYPQLRWFYDKKYIAEIGAKNYVTNPVLDSARDFKLKLTLCDTIRGALLPARSCYDVAFYDLEIKVDSRKKQIAGLNRIYFSVSDTTAAIQVDLFDNYDIHYVRMNGSELSYVRSCQAIFIRPGDTLFPGEKQCIEISYSGIPVEATNPPWNGGFVWKTRKNKPWVGVACENLGASSWWPVKDHLSDKPDSVRMTIIVPGSNQVIANGNLRSVKVNDNKTTSYEWFVSYPINIYNVSFYIGEFVNFNEINENDSESYRVDYYVLKNNLKKAKEYYARTGQVLDIFGELFGPYPFPNDGAGFVEAPYRGMEHQGAIAIGGEYEEDRHPQLESDINLLVVHEAAHEWWGNAVAIGDMADAWINEGFGIYAEYLFLEKAYSYEKYLEAFGTYSLNIMNTWPLVGERNVNENTFLTGDIYFKGAAMLNNLRCLINNDIVFFRIIKGFNEEYRMKVSTTDDFIEYVRKEYPVDLSDFFNAFLYQADPPVLRYSYTFMRGTLLFNYAWTGVGNNFTMPFALVINDAVCVRLNGTTSNQTYKVNNVSTFYLPNPGNFDAELLDPNSFTYFTTYLMRD
jgi:aminopeptidase N